MSDLTEMINFKTKKYTWGIFEDLHSVANFQIVEYKDSRGETAFHPYVDERDTCQSYATLKQAIIASIVFECGSLDTQVCSELVFKMIGLGDR